MIGRADLGIAKADAPDPVVAGETLTYRVTVTNAGPSDAHDVRVTDTLPAGVTFQETVGCAEDPNGVPVCTLGTIPAGTSKSYQIKVGVDSATLGLILNTATVTSSTGDPNPIDNTVTIDTTVIGRADLGIAKADAPDPVVAGETLTYTVTVTNAGPSDARDVRVTDTLPAGVTFQETVGCAEDPNGVPVCTLGTIPAGTSKSYQIKVGVDSATLGLILNTATVTSSTGDPNTIDNTVTIDTTVIGRADLGIAKADAPDPVVAGETLTYTVTVTNAGPSDAPTCASRTRCRRALRSRRR